MTDVGAKVEVADVGWRNGHDCKRLSVISALGGSHFEHGRARVGLAIDGLVDNDAGGVNPCVRLEVFEAHKGVFGNLKQK